jgi:hypothetical protein
MTRPFAFQSAASDFAFTAGHCRIAISEAAAFSIAFRPTHPARRLAGLSMVQHIGFDGSGLAATHRQRINNINADSA